MSKKALTLTIIANMTSNYGEGLGNISSVQKIFRNGKTYATTDGRCLKRLGKNSKPYYPLHFLPKIDYGTVGRIPDEINSTLLCSA